MCCTVQVAFVLNKFSMVCYINFKVQINNSLKKNVQQKININYLKMTSQEGTLTYYFILMECSCILESNSNNKTILSRIESRILSHITNPFHYCIYFRLHVNWLPWSHLSHIEHLSFKLYNLWGTPSHITLVKIPNNSKRSSINDNLNGHSHLSMTGKVIHRDRFVV